MTMIRAWIVLCLLFVCLVGEGLAPATAVAAISKLNGVVVEGAEPGFAAHKAGLRPGDVLLSWRRPASPPAQPDAASGTIDSPFGLLEVEVEQAARGELTVSGRRGGESLVVRLPPGEWRLHTRPRLIGSELDTYQEASDLIDGNELDRGLSLWRELAFGFREAGDHVTASWLLLKVAANAAERGDWESAGAAFEQAQGEAEVSGDVSVQTTISDSLARSLQDRGELELAAAAYQETLEIRKASPVRPLGVAKSLHELGALAMDRGDLQSAADYFRRSLAIREEFASQSLDVADSLDGLGKSVAYRGDVAAAEEHFRRALAIKEKLVPPGIEIAVSFNNLGCVAFLRGDLAAAEELFRRSLAIKEKLAPQSLDLAKSLSNLGLVAWIRGDLTSADAYYRRSLAIRERLGPQGIAVAEGLHGPGSVARIRGDLAAAEDYYRRSLAIFEQLAPQSLGVARSLAGLGNVAGDRGDMAAAEELFHRSLAITENLAPGSELISTCLGNLGEVAFHRKDFATAAKYLRRALAISEKLAPRSINTAAFLNLSGDIALARSDLETAEALYLRSLSIHRERAPGSALEAESCQRLAALHRHRGEPDQALVFYDCAVEALEAQKGRLGGSDEVRSGFGATHADTYRQAIDLLVQVGKPQQAFHLLERYRAREFLTLLAGRDLVFSTDIPEAIDRQRRSANRSYDSAFGQRMQLSDRAGDEEQRRAREELETARRRQDELRAEIRAASPRLAALHDPLPMNLAETRAALDPGTLLLSYAVGKDSGHLFAVGSQGELGVFPLAVGEKSLRAEVERFREAMSRGRFDRRPEKILLQARRLSELLLAPVAAQIAQAERLLILADGPLHSLPFAALIHPGAIDGRRYLVEAKPIHFAASATVFALLKQERRERRPIWLTAFGDPQYPASAPRDEDTAPQLRAAMRSFDLTPLPATRGEVEGLERLYPETSRIYLGADATEGRAKAVGPETTHLHIASHGLLDDRSPLDSALALSIPERWQEGQDNGLLQAWEIFEQVRLDAELVTLSACDTGLGKVLGGEGLLGLTRAFQYAGARSVLASLWGVSDASTGELMKRFYGYLKQGQSKAEALRNAQLDLLRDSEYSHPFHWAGFQLVGDWR